MLTLEERRKRDKLQKNKPAVYRKILDFEEKVAKKESIAIIQFQYNYACNFKCQHCDITSLRKEARSFTPKDVEKLSKEADEMGLAHMVITGGEPLVFKDFDDVVHALDPYKFFITSDTNGWFLDDDRALHLRDLGVDKIQLSLDSLDKAEHDSFRNKPGSWNKCMMAIGAAKYAGLDILVQTVVTKQRVRSQELVDFIEYLNKMDVGVFITYAKPVGNWTNNFDILVDKDDMEYVRELEKKYNVFTHLTPAYGLNLGCIAVKRMISITQYGDVMPCPYIHISLGNVFEEPLKDIVARGMRLKCIWTDTCLIAEDRNFIENVEVKKIYGKELPVSYKEVFTDEDFTR